MNSKELKRIKETRAKLKMRADKVRKHNILVHKIQKTIIYIVLPLAFLSIGIVW